MMKADMNASDANTEEGNHRNLFGTNDKGEKDASSLQQQDSVVGKGGGGGEKPHEKETGTNGSSPREGYYALRKGKSVNCCIFLQWEDCKGQIDGYRDAEYSVFDTLENAIQYIKPFPDWEPPRIRKCNKRKAESTSTSSNSNSNSSVAAKKPKRKNSKAKKPKAGSELKQKGDESADYRGILDTITDTGLTSSQVSNAAPTTRRTKNDRNRYYEPLHEVLRQGYRKNRDKGWRAKDLGLTFRGAQKTETQARYLRDLAELRGYIAAAPPPSSSNINDNTATNKVAKAKIKSTHKIQNPHSIIYLNYAWGVNRKYHNDLEDKMNAPPDATRDSTAFTSCTIENREAARMRYTAKKLFLNHRVEELTNESKLYNLFNADAAATKGTDDGAAGIITSVSREKKREWHEQAKQEWENLSAEERKYWEDREKQHDLQQPFIKGMLIEALRNDPKRSTAKLVEDIGFWCGKSTVAKWRLGRDYGKQTIPTKGPNNHPQRLTQTGVLLAPNHIDEQRGQQQRAAASTIGHYPNNIIRNTGFGGSGVEMGQTLDQHNDASFALALDGVEQL